MGKKYYPLFLFALFLLSFNSLFSQSDTRSVIIGYVGGYNGNIIDPSQVAADKMTHINYAFVDVKDNRAWLHNEKTDTVNFWMLNQLKRINPDLKIMISVGGWTWSKNFSDAVLTDSSTNNFAQSCVDIAAQYDLDGVDIDWEYPGMKGDNNVFRPEDRQGYTRLFRMLREKLDHLSKRTGKKYFVTTAIGGSREFLQHTELGKAQKYLDYINLMSYDFDGTYDNMAAHHSNLYSPRNMPYIYSVDVCVANMESVGVMPGKIVVGIPFYGKGRVVKSDENNGLYQIPVRMSYGGGYTRIKDSLVNQRGFVRHWDRASEAPYLFNKETKTILFYDDEESVKLKCDYIKTHGLAGAMFWEYFADSKLYLLNTLNKELWRQNQEN